jgi:hypothetical protein
MGRPDGWNREVEHKPNNRHSRFSQSAVLSNPHESNGRQVIADFERMIGKQDDALAGFDGAGVEGGYERAAESIVPGAALRGNQHLLHAQYQCQPP